ncbi:MAG: hypothetical protein BGO88_02520 [Flavobacterium sp. 38-13]|nr:MAG: hypothetical protein BGO88_02520 [Flavobacterium sp. 38-13]
MPLSILKDKSNDVILSDLKMSILTKTDNFKYFNAWHKDCLLVHEFIKLVKNKIHIKTWVK